MTITIGKGDGGSQAFRIATLSEDTDTYHLAANDTSFWITDGYLGTRLVIMKNTTAGKYIAKIARKWKRTTRREGRTLAGEAQADYDTLREYAISLTLAAVGREDAGVMRDSDLRRAFDDGVWYARRNIRKGMWTPYDDWKRRSWYQRPK